MAKDANNIASCGTENLIYQIRGHRVMLDSRSLRSQFVILKQGEHRKYLPYVFTEQGVAMLSNILRSPRAVQVNIEIMRTFVRLRQWLASNAELTKRLNDLENKYDEQFKAVFEAIRELMVSLKTKCLRLRAKSAFTPFVNRATAKPKL